MKPLFNLKHRRRIAIFDWSNIVARAYFVDQDQYLGKICKMLRRYRKRLRSHEFVFAIEGRGTERRREIFPGYKEGRGARDRPSEVVSLSLGLLRHIKGTLVKAPEGEADDAIATYCQRSYDSASAILIVSEDRDLWQLIDRRIHVLTRKGEVGPEECRALMKVRPKNVLMLKALLGDPSDSIPRVPRLTTKTALRLAQECHDIPSFNALLEEADWIPEGDRKRIAKHHSVITCNAKVVRLISNASLEVEPREGSASDLLGFLVHNRVHTIGPQDAKIIAEAGAVGTARRRR